MANKNRLGAWVGVGIYRFTEGKGMRSRGGWFG